MKQPISKILRNMSEIKIGRNKLLIVNFKAERLLCICRHRRTDGQSDINYIYFMAKL